MIVLKSNRNIPIKSSLNTENRRNFIISLKKKKKKKQAPFQIE